MKKSISIQQLHTFGLAVEAAEYCLIESEEQLREQLPLKVPFFILGGGTNILFTQHFEGLILHNKIKGIELVQEDEKKVWLKIGGGEVWHDLVLWCIDQGYGGIENLSLIPGSVGAAPIQNIGAYGVELKDVFHSLEAIELATGKQVVFSLEDCCFGYRDSIFKQEMKGKYMITRVVLELSKQPTLNVSYGAIQTVLASSNEALSIKTVSNAIVQIRTSKLPDPNKIGNAGSFFKNPIVAADFCQQLKEQYPKMPVYEVDHQHKKIAAAWLIDQMGWKGYRRGDAGVHTEQALVLVNYGHATGREIWQLAKEIQASVKDKFGIELEMEVNIL